MATPKSPKASACTMSAATATAYRWCVILSAARVLASDASHYYANMDEKNPFPIVYDLGAMAQGWDKAKRLAGHEDRVIPGHDPKVRALYPTHPGSDGEIVALHLAPIRSR